MKQITGLDYKIKEMAARIRELREIEGLSVADMAQKTAVSEEEYTACENGESDLNFAFIYRCALAFNVDVTASDRLLTLATLGSGTESLVLLYRQMR